MSPTLTSDAPPDSGRTRIMDEAATLFLQQGYDATSLRHIADVVGMKAEDAPKRTARTNA